uniref:Photosystem II Psb31 protein domain-containing protein n=1 Tax=Phaeomonas parva TaxID=124430 RepID=A0A7S1XY29_9STRA|mmetsp:Transcript_43725/g.137323  ORF Transcript_43725/g.137323 Transcript_43725/m.137323 type:complete len:171 (+) Transcript_43725:374-886(+)
MPLAVATTSPNTTPYLDPNHDPNPNRSAAVAKFGAALGAGLTLGASGAMADGAVSDATRARARGLQGPKILATKGEPAAVLEESTAFELFNAGGLKRKDQIQTATAAYKNLVAAAKSGDASATKSAYSEYLKATGLDKPSPFNNAKDNFQGSSSDFNWTKNTELGYTYVR